ncbi:MAG: zinc ribbon domain-containing protein [Gemmatimonadaceae bacterium]
MDDLDRMFQRLLYNIRNSYPEYLTRPFEVSELYQTLIPYRHNRRELEIETNEDYEMAMLGLIAGARGYLKAEDGVQRVLRQELESPNPDTSAFRAYAHSPVSIAQDAEQRLEGNAGDGSREPISASPFAPPPRPPASAAPARRAPSSAPAQPRVETAKRSQRAAPRKAAAPSPLPRSMATVPPAPAAAPTSFPSASEPSQTHPGAMATPQRYVTANALGGSCSYCGGSLPDARRLVFCPHCGQNLTVQHCPACGTELEVGWKFCTTCGRGVAQA